MGSFEDGPLPKWPRGVRWAAETCFSAGVAIKNAAYDADLLQPRRLNRPVISVGNLAVGGSGKTPLVIDLCHRLHARGLHVGVLSRGHGRSTKERDDSPCIVATQGNLHVDADQGGDEPVLIARRTRATVVVANDRFLAGKVAIELGANVLLLDDGFQHRRLHRDADVVLIDHRTARAGGRLMPTGWLREPMKSLSRATLVAVHVGDAVRPEATVGRAPESSAPTIFVAVHPRRILTSAGPRGLDNLAGRRITCVAAIAHPERFVATLEGLGATVVHRAFFPDHMPFGVDAVQQARAQGAAAGAEVVVTTEKDLVRSPDAFGAIDAWTLEIDLQVVAGETHVEQLLHGVLAPPGSPPP